MIDASCPIEVAGNLSKLWFWQLVTVQHLTSRQNFLFPSTDVMMSFFVLGWVLFCFILFFWSFFCFVFHLSSLLEFQGNSLCLPQGNVYYSASFPTSLSISWTFSNKWVPFISGTVVNKIFPISLYVDKRNQAQDQRYIHLHFILASFCAFNYLVLLVSVLWCMLWEMMPTLFQMANHFFQK